VQTQLKAIIEGKRKKQRRKPAAKGRGAAPEPADNVINIMEALKQSLSQELSKKKRT